MRKGGEGGGWVGDTGQTVEQIAELLNRLLQFS